MFFVSFSPNYYLFLVINNLLLARVYTILTINCPSWGDNSPESWCPFSDVSSDLGHFIEPENLKLFEENYNLFTQINDDFCKLDKQIVCAIKDHYPQKVKSVKTFSNLLLLTIRKNFISDLNPNVLLPELKSPSRTTEVKIRLIRLVSQTDLFNLIDNVDTIQKPEALAIISRTPTYITHFNSIIYTKMTLILTKGFRFDQLNLFKESSQYRDYLQSILTGIENGFKDEPLTCFESQKLFEFVRKLVHEVKTHSRFAYDYYQSYSIWVKVWAQILPCVSVDETLRSKSRTIQVVDSVIKTNPNFDFSPEMGANLLFLFLRNAPSINTQNGENFAFDSVSHLWQYATYQHFQYIKKLYSYSRSLKSPITIYNMFSLPESSVFTTKLAQIACRYTKELSCIGYVRPDEREELLRLNNFKTDLIPIGKLSWATKRQVAALVLSNQITGIPLTSKLKTLGGLISGVDTHEILNMVVNSSQKEVPTIILNELQTNETYFGQFQKRLLISGLLNKTSDMHDNLKVNLWENVPFPRFLQASKSISEFHLESIKEQFLNQAWKSKYAQVLNEDFKLSFETRIKRSISTKGSWVFPEEILEHSSDFFDVFTLIQSVTDEQSSEYAKAVAEKIEKFYISFTGIDQLFSLQLIEQPILASIPGKLLREFPVKSHFSMNAFSPNYYCRELISKIGQLNDNYRYSDARNQQFAHLFVNNCEHNFHKQVMQKTTISKQMLYSMGNLVCYLSPSYIQAMEKDVLESSLSVFDQCCLTANQSKAIYEKLTNHNGEENDVTKPKVEYMIHSNLFCQVFDFDFSLIEISEAANNIISQKDPISAIYEFVNRGGVLADGHKIDSKQAEKSSINAQCRRKFRLSEQFGRYENCHRNSTELILLLQSENLKCDTLKILGKGELSYIYFKIICNEFSCGLLTY